MNDIKKAIINDAESVINNLAIGKVQNPSIILNCLLEQIKKVDFRTLAYPEYPSVLKEFQRVKSLVTDEDGSFNSDADKDLKDRWKILSKKMNGFKLSKNHYLVLCIERLSATAKANKWALAKRNGFIYLFNGCYWEEIDKEHFQSFLGSVALKMGVEKYQAKIFTFQEMLFKQFLSDAYIEMPELEMNRVLINLNNGTFDIVGNHKNLRDFEKEDFLTYQLPFDYDEGAKSPLFFKFLDEVIPDKSKQLVLAEYIGSLFVKTSVLKLEKVLFLYGTGANGKSVFFDIINALLGRFNVSNYNLDLLTDNNGYYRAKIVNKLVNYASEINGKLASEKFKTLASGEPIDARLPYGEPFEINTYAKFIFNGNGLPTDVEHTDAFFRRFMIVNFDVTIPEDKQDRELSKKIINHELAGVFNWVLEGLDRLLIQKGFSKCEAIDKALNEYEAKSDSVRMFIDEEGYERSINHYTPIKDLYQVYKMFCLEDGYRSVGKSKFITRLKHHKVDVKRISTGNVAYLVRDDVSFEI